MGYIPIHEEHLWLPTKLNDEDYVVSHFERLNTRLNSMEMEINNYGTNLSAMENQMTTMDDRLSRMKWNQERYIRDSQAFHGLSLDLYNFYYNQDNTPR